ncbi:hypothetical protein PTT_08319 [Pyrenophora teres f. teres 0-1]|uniref:non-specific serine/threonine protein kinase n=1 Tax=Pyrenophora teres f. teres (strain 0-1) TaxID=861557 RepID=E3RJJ2_PYRTT|nr:hypothetical protein PTT_08319 [Pyrenophora teres f. teres 0-1]
MGILQRLRRFAKNSGASRQTEDTPRRSQGSEGAHGSSSKESRNNGSAHLKKLGKAAGTAVLAMVKLNLGNGGKNKSNANATPNYRGLKQHGRYSFICHLGSGANGDVDLCRDKRFVPGLSPERRSIPYISPSTLEIVFEYCPVGDMLGYAASFQGHVPEMFIWHAFKHVACGLAFLHERGVVHGDIKLANILLASPREGETYPLPKIADFGAAAIKPSCRIPWGHMGTLGWQPPEESYHHGPESDVWALGCMVHKLALGLLPVERQEIPNIDIDEWFDANSMRVPVGTEYPAIYKDMCVWMAYNQIVSMRIDYPSYPKSMVYSKLLNYVMMRALDTDHRARITASQLHLFLPALEEFADYVLVSGRGVFLDMIRERGEDGTGITDFDVFRQVFDGTVYRADEQQSPGMLEVAMGLIPLMDSEEQVKASQFIAGASSPPWTLDGYSTLSIFGILSHFYVVSVGYEAAKNFPSRF